MKPNDMNIKNDNARLRTALHNKELDYTKLEEKYNAVLQTNKELEAELDKLFNEGALWYREENGYVAECGVIPPYAKRTYIQEMPNEIGSILYDRFKYVKMVNGTRVDDNEKLKLYKGAKLL